MYNLQGKYILLLYEHLFSAISTSALVCLYVWTKILLKVTKKCFLIKALNLFRQAVRQSSSCNVPKK